MASTAQSTTATKKAAKVAPATSTPKAQTSTTKRAPRRNGAARVDSNQRRNYIEVAAYYIAERRGFVGGNEADDWAAAEEEIDRLLSEGKLNS